MHVGFIHRNAADGGDRLDDGGDEDAGPGGGGVRLQDGGWDCLADGVIEGGGLDMMVMREGNLSSVVRTSSVGIWPRGQ